MVISELVKRLEEIKAKEGDISCVCHDGLDPSDPALVVDVEVDSGGLQPWRCWNRVVAVIRS